MIWGNSEECDNDTTEKQAYDQWYEEKRWTKETLKRQRKVQLNLILY
jgi:hypothetical protein